MFVSQLAGKTEYCSDQDTRFPQRLRTIRNAPKGLYYRGDIEALDRMRCVAVVGTRNASPHGLEAAYQIGRLAAENDLIVVNGLALGIDAAAIQGALSAGGVGSFFFWKRVLRCSIGLISCRLFDGRSFFFVIKRTAGELRIFCKRDYIRKSFQITIGGLGFVGFLFCRCTF